MYHRVCRVVLVAALLVLQACKGHSAILPNVSLCIDFCSSGSNPAEQIVIGPSPSLTERFPPNYRTLYPVGSRVSLYLVEILPGGNPMLKADTIRSVTWTSSNDSIARFAPPSVPGRGDLDGIAAGEVRIKVAGARYPDAYVTIWACGSSAYPGGNYGGSCAPMDGIRFVP